MISFTCTCGKTYQLPDRHAGREVRCNQCEKTLVVPQASQTEPVIPLDDQKQAKPTTKSDAGTEKKSLPIVPVAAAVVVALIVGVVLGKVIFHPPVKLDTEAIVSATNTNLSEKLKAGAATLQQVIEEKSQELSARLEVPASDVAEVVKETDDAKRSEEMTKIVESRQKDRSAAALAEMQGRFVRFMTEFADSCQEPEKHVPYELFAGPGKPAFSVNDWRVGDRVPTAFAVKTLDGAPILLSIDVDPVAAGKKDGDVLDVLADAVKTEDEKVKDDQKHEKSFRIDSASREEFGLLWPGEGRAGVSGEKIKEFRFSLYVPEKPNAVFKPGKPEGMDKTLVLSSIRLRLVADNGIIEYAPANREHFARIMERCRSGWLPIRIPIQGDETWKRSDFGLAGPLVVDRIELRAKPTGAGVTLWVDHLAVVE